MRTPQWCYVLTSYGQKLTVIPLTSIKSNSGPARAPFEFDIDEGDGVKGRMHFDDMRYIDKMRVIAKKGYSYVQTPRAEIEVALKKFINLYNQHRLMGNSSSACFIMLQTLRFKGVFTF